MHTSITNLKTTQKLTNKLNTITINIKTKTNLAQKLLHVRKLIGHVTIIKLLYTFVFNKAIKQH